MGINLDSDPGGQYQGGSSGSTWKMREGRGGDRGKGKYVEKDQSEVAKKEKEGKRKGGQNPVW